MISELVPAAGDPSVLDSRCLILADPKDGPERLKRKGVLLVSFTRTAGLLARKLGTELVRSRYHVVLEPSWSGYADPDILVWAASGDPVVVQASDARDRALLQSLKSALHPVPFGASDWVDNQIFYPMNIDRDYDAIWVGNCGYYKRVHAFLRAVSRAAKISPDYRAAVIAASWGGSQQAVKELFEYFDLTRNVDVYWSVPYVELNHLYNRAKVCVLTSLKEGSNRAIFEAMNCNTPIIVLEENVGVNKDYINSATGRVVQEKGLVSALLHMRERYREYSANAWAKENIAPEVTTARLAKVLSELFLDETWAAQDLAIKVNRPEAQFRDGSESRFSSAVRGIRMRTSGPSGTDTA